MLLVALLSLFGGCNLKLKMQLVWEGTFSLRLIGIDEKGGTLEMFLVTGVADEDETNYCNNSHYWI